jgi:pSer/pThr/pTyr-binding forkhead associated (FHA) protein
MPKVIVLLDDVVVKEVQLVKEKTTIGRRPYNDIVIDNLAVSGEHAIVQTIAGNTFLEDLNSTNGTYLNGTLIKKQRLQNGDTFEIGKCKLKFLGDLNTRPTGSIVEPSDNAGNGTLQAAIKVLSGSALGREVPLTKVVTTIGKPGIGVAAVTRRQHGYVVHHVEGAGNPTLNGETIGSDPIPLKHGDVIELAGTRMQFVQI